MGDFISHPACTCERDRGGGNACFVSPPNVRAELERVVCASPPEEAKIKQLGVYLVLSHDWEQSL